MTDTITLAKEEVREARQNWFDVYGYECAWKYSLDDEFCAEFAQGRAFCRLCKKLTQFAAVHCPNTGRGEDE